MLASAQASNGTLSRFPGFITNLMNCLIKPIYLILADVQSIRSLKRKNNLMPTTELLFAGGNWQQRIKWSQLGARCRHIHLPLRVRRITLRQAFSDRQPRLVGRQCPWPITLRSCRNKKKSTLPNDLRWEQRSRGGSAGGGKGRGLQGIPTKSGYLVLPWAEQACSCD